MCAGAREAIRSATRTASSRRSSGRSARAASMPTTRRSTGPTSGPLAMDTRVVPGEPFGLPAASVTPPRSGPARTTSRSGCPGRRRRATPRARRERRDQRQPQAGPTASGLGPRPRPRSSTITRIPCGSGSSSTRIAFAAPASRLAVGVADDVRAGLGDREAHVLDQAAGKRELLGDRLERAPDHRDVARVRRQRQPNGRRRHADRSESARNERVGA